MFRITAGCIAPGPRARRAFVLSLLLHLLLQGAGCSSPAQAPGGDVGGDAPDVVDVADVGEGDGVEGPQAQYVVVKPGPAHLAPGTRVALEAFVYDILEQDIAGAPVQWRVLEEAVATVSEEGVVTAHTVGRTEVEATSGPARGRASLVVEPLAALAIEPDGGELGVGEELALAVHGHTHDGKRLLALPPVAWRVDDPSLARITDDGTLEGLLPGRVEVTAEAAGVEASARFDIELKFDHLTCRGSTCCAISRQQQTYCWGSIGHESEPGEDGEANPHPVYSDVPVRVEGAPPFVEIALVGVAARCGLTAEGEVYCWGGRNVFGILGSDDQSEIIMAPRRLRTDVRFSQIDMGGRYTACGLSRDDGGLYCWGRYSLVRFEGSPFSPDDFSSTPYLVSAGPFRDLTMSHEHLCVLDEQGTAYCLGRGVEGQLGDGRRQTSGELVEVVADQPFEAIRATNSGTCALDRDLHVWCWGTNRAAMLGHPQEIVWDPPMVLDVPQRTSFIAPIVQLARKLGGRNFCGVTKDGNVACWGTNHSCQLGKPYHSLVWSPEPVLLSELVDDPVEITMAYQFGCVVTAEGDVWCWGLNAESPRFYGGWYNCSPQLWRLRTFAREE